CGFNAWLLASQDELAYPGGRLFVSGLPGVRHQALVRRSYIPRIWALRLRSSATDRPRPRSTDKVLARRRRRNQFCKLAHGLRIIRKSGPLRHSSLRSILLPATAPGCAAYAQRFG